MNNIDKLTKVLLAVIAVALCMIALNPWLRPVVAEAQSQSNRYHVTHQLVGPYGTDVKVTLR